LFGGGQNAIEEPLPVVLQDLGDPGAFHEVEAVAQDGHEPTLTGNAKTSKRRNAGSSEFRVEKLNVSPQCSASSFASPTLVQFWINKTGSMPSQTSRMGCILSLVTSTIPWATACAHSHRSFS